ncbi:MAG: tRNA 2-thiouridine(34) synthase MnmA [Acholeplasmataceae bacterium]|nr:tRNA 2-thiouridine(34) synthase MnmA [Acholeplasmataceae bacterium]
MITLKLIIYIRRIMNNTKRPKVILGMSGGVDSSVAAYLLLKEGFEVEAVFMRNWDSTINYDILGNPTLNDEICPQEIDYQDAKKVSDKLGIKLHRVDFVKEYWEKVFSYFLDEYRQNRTPNPDVLCNNEIKFKAFIDYASTLDYDYIAMGHYARVIKENGQVKLFKALDLNKDQSYFLSQLTEKQLEKVIFPLGNLNKEEVRKIAYHLDLETKDKKDSTGICFIGERNFNEFLANYLPAKEGLIKRLDGTILGRHFGLMNYTIGQRKGIGLGTIIGLDGPWYVVGKDLASNTLIVENKDHLDYLKSDECLVKDLVLRTDLTKSSYQAKFRYRQKDQPVEITLLADNKALIKYNNIKAVTPGQVLAIYDNDECIGAGFIDEVFYQGEKRRYS